MYLTALIENATSRARFVRHDSTPENLRLLRLYLKRWGRPQAFYTNKASLFRTPRPPEPEEQLEGQRPRTQIGRALQELGIEWIPAPSPQAKGRIERFFGTAQDRLVKGLRKAGVDTLPGAQQYLERVYLPLWNRRFTVAAILSQVESRVVAPDYTLQLHRQRYQIARGGIRPGLRGVRVEKRLDGTVAVRFREHYLPVSVCKERSQKSRSQKTERERPASGKLYSVEVFCPTFPFIGPLVCSPASSGWGLWGSIFFLWVRFTFTLGRPALCQ